MIVTKDRNPRPIISGDPNGLGFGAAMFGHKAKKPAGPPRQLEPFERNGKYS
jgi:hypothetical protein